MRIESTGSGSPPIVLVHGFGANRRFWRKWAPALTARTLVLTVDLLEPSPRGGDREPSPMRQAVQLADFIRSTQWDTPPVLVGHSLGGGIAVAASLELLEDAGAPKPAGLVLVSGAVIPQELPRYMSLARRRGLGEIFLVAAPPRPIMRFGLKGLVADPATIDDAQVDAYREPLLKRDTRRAILRAARALDLDDARAITRRLAEVRVPTLLIWGSEDRIVPPEAGRRLAAAIPFAEIFMLEGVGHLPPEEAPARSLAPLLRFLDAIEAGPGGAAPSAE